MKKFDFKLQPLLKYRQYLERIARQKAAGAILDVKTCEQQIARLKQTHDQNTRTIEDRVVQGVTALEFRRFHEYLNAVETGMEDERSRKIRLKQILEKKLLELKKKSVDKKAMELYRERLKIQYTQDALKMEQKELDEISSIKTARKISHETT